jgi:uncharacterized membrane protein YfcA
MTFAVLRPAAGPHDTLLAIVRPFLVLAALAFFAGFGGCLILGPANVMGLRPDPPADAAAVSAPASVLGPASAPVGDWNFPKQI